MGLVVTPKGCDDSVKKAIQQLARKLEHVDFYSFTASRLIAADSTQQLSSVSDLTSWIAGTANQITVTDDGDGTLTLSLPQDIHTGASPTLNDLTISSPSNIYALSHDSFADVHQDVNTTATPTFNGLTSTGILDASAGEVLTEDNDVAAPTGKSDGYIGVAIVGGQSRVYFAVNGTMYYIDGTASAVPVTGNPIGLLLALTYNLE